MSPQTLAKLLTIFVGLLGLIYAGEDSYYSYWKPEDSSNFDEDAYQSLQSVPHEKQDFANFNPIGKFINGIQSRQLGGSLVPVSVFSLFFGHQDIFFFQSDCLIYFSCLLEQLLLWEWVVSFTMTI